MGTHDGWGGSLDTKTALVLRDGVQRVSVSGTVLGRRERKGESTSWPCWG